MIIFFGTREVVRDDDRPRGEMQQCPRCGRYGVFKPRSSRTFAHIFWIPLIPLGKAQPLIECPNCGARFSVVA
jgi:DNA-directed RNA polymerase subunit RPC12/RpoP